MVPEVSQQLDHLYERTRIILAHAWTVRAFVRHSDEADDFPEITEIGRAVFDLSRALESRVNDRAGYFRMLRKKIGKLRAAAEKFAVDAAKASSHTNFEQATVSIRGCVQELEEVLARFNTFSVPVVAEEPDDEDSAG